MARILTITSWYPPHHYGGYELSCFDVMTRLIERGHDVRILCGDEKLPDARPPEPEHERRVFRELRPHLKESGGYRPSLLERVAIERQNRATLERHMADHQPHVVSFWHMVAISGSLLRYVVKAEVPAVYVVCDDWPLYVEKIDAWLSLFNGGVLRTSLGSIVAAATGLVTRVGDLGTSGPFCFVSEATRRHVVANAPGSYPLSTVVYSGIEPNQFPDPIGLAGKPWGWRLLYVGRLDARKGVDTLLRALPHLPAEATLACIGRGGANDRERLNELAHSLGVLDRVAFASLEREELATRYQSADVVIFPSEWNEPFGLVPIEAMACGTPVIATGVGGSGEFLSDGFNCVLFPAGDPVALARAVRRIHAKPQLGRAIASGGLLTANEFVVDRLADVLEAWHVAAAERFSSGCPPDRVLDLPGLTESTGRRTMRRPRS